MITPYRTAAELEAGLADIRQSPKDVGTLELIVRRPAVDEREVLNDAELNSDVGLVGDTWIDRPSRHTPDMQINVMNARAAALVAVERDRWALAGDQLYVDFDLSSDNIPPGTRIAVGNAVLEITAHPHRGCKKFSARFGLAAMKFVNSPAGVALNLRGVNAKVVRHGRIRRGDVVRKL